MSRCGLKQLNCAVYTHIWSTVLVLKIHHIPFRHSGLETPVCLNGMVEWISRSMVPQFDLVLRISIQQFLDRASRVAVKAMEKLAGDFGLS